MKKILVPTDLSKNSRSGVRFAIHMAAKAKMELIFIHVLYLLPEINWTETYFQEFAKEEEALCRKELEKFIYDIYRKMKIKPAKHSFVITQGMSADIAILDHCRIKKDLDCICISTRGAGRLKKVYGTNTGNLITKSAVPVLAIPKAYKVHDIKSVLYATDFRNYLEELNKVMEFSSQFKAKIEVVHFAWPEDIPFEESVIETVSHNKYRYGLKVHYQKNDAVHTLIENLQNQIAMKKPSIVVMFTEQERTFFQRIFFASQSEEMSFKLKDPLLVFKKGVA